MKQTGFFAYPSSPEDLNENAKLFLEEINKKESSFKINDWKNLKISGKVIIKSILDEIKKSDFFVCDLTYLNSNVLFELGYAIGINKKITILLNKTIEMSNKLFDKFNLLKTIGYINYSNHFDIIKSFNNQDFQANSKDLVVKENSFVENNNTQPFLFYLKSNIDTDASLKLQEKLRKQNFIMMTDDTTEISSRPLSWYLENIINAEAVIIHLASDNFKDAQLENAKKAFIAGIALGTGKKFKMIAHHPFNPPIDYMDYLSIHKTAIECEKVADEWLDDVKKIAEHKDLKEKKKKDSKLKSLKAISIGDPVAENESNIISEYFIETPAFLQAKKNRNTLFVGRKGVGKTANFYMLYKFFADDKRNFVCDIKPETTEIEGLFSIFESIKSKSDTGYLAESFWKYLIYSEISKKLYEYLMGRNAVTLNNEEIQFKKFVEDNSGLINDDFSVRMTYAVKRISSLGDDGDSNFRIKISEGLHDKIIKEMHKYIGNILSTKEKVVVLIDNLDKAWIRGMNIQEMSSLIFGLLNVIEQMAKAFTKQDFWRKPVNIMFVTFLRNDIYAYIHEKAGEKDKLMPAKIYWHQDEILFRIIEQRFLFSLGNSINKYDIWTKYFCSKVGDLSLYEHIMSVILPRPRDLLVFFKACMNKAISYEHNLVEESDVYAAEVDYSKFAFESLLSENIASIASIEEFFFEFCGDHEVINESDIKKSLSVCKIDITVDQMINTLINTNFIGYETMEDKFEFLYDEEIRKKYEVMARKVAEKRGDKVKRFKIHRAFHSCLSIRRTI